MVILSWTDGIRKVIIDFRIYSEHSDTKINLALELLSYARNRLLIKPDFVLFDSWYSSKTILRRIRDYDLGKGSLRREGLIYLLNRNKFIPAVLWSLSSIF
jgi:hypothetical protein